MVSGFLRSKPEMVSSPGRIVSWRGPVFHPVMPGLVPGIHVLAALKSRKTWMAGTSPAMTKNESVSSVKKEAIEAEIAAS
jgi:hypothetical protein